MNKDALNRAIVGALREAINAHGPITNLHLSSAAKRITGQVLTFLHNEESKCQPPTDTAESATRIAPNQG